MRDPGFGMRDKNYLASRISHPASWISSEPDEIQEKLAPEINHSAPGILYLTLGRRFQDAFLDVVRDLVAEVVLDFELDPIFVHRIDHARFHQVLPQEFLMALVKLPERLVRPLPVDLELRRQL